LVFWSSGLAVWDNWDFGDIWDSNRYSVSSSFEQPETT